MSRFRFRKNYFCLLVLWLAMPAMGQQPKITFRADGAAVFDNALIQVAAANRPGSDNGLVSWLYKPTGYEMINVLYGQTDYIQGHALGEHWDPVDMKGIEGGAVNVGNLYVPVQRSHAADGSAVSLTQNSAEDYQQQRTIIMRRDLATLEIRYTLKNIKSAPGGYALRFHSAMSPGARGNYQSRDENIFVPTEAGVIALDQSLPNDQFYEKYKNDKFFLPVWKDEPSRAWVAGPLRTPALQGNWAAQVNAKTGDGIAFIMDPTTLLGFYNCPGYTLEPTLRAFSLAKGESWHTSVFLTSFTGIVGPNATVHGVTPLYVATVPVAVQQGTLSGTIIPLFKGTLRVENGNGKAVFTAPAAAGQPIAIQAAIAEHWKIVAQDQQGTVIGSIDENGQVKLSQPAMVMEEKPQRPVREAIYCPPNSDEQVRRFLQPRDFTVNVAWSASEAEKKAAADIAARLGVGLNVTNPGGKMLVIGQPGDNSLVRDAGLLNNSVTAHWPGPGKGAVLTYDAFAGTEKPILIIGGSDAAGTAKAIQFFEHKFMAGLQAPTGYAFWATSNGTKVLPFTRPTTAEASDKIQIEVARGEYESSQMVITPYQDLNNITVTVAPLVNRDNGRPIDSRFEGGYRRQNGPLWLRWVNYYPLKPEPGASFYPDPLLERTTSKLEAGQSQGLWLTTMISDYAEPGVYTSSITCKAGNEQKTIPLEVKVLDFTQPHNGLLGEGYMSLENYPAGEKRLLDQPQVEAFVQDWVSHGFRVIHLGPADMFHWKFSPTGEFKGKGNDWVEVSDDGKVALDTVHFDELVDWCDAAAKPFALRYMMYNQAVVRDFDYLMFKRTLPNRYTKPAGADANLDYYEQEMLQLYKRHLEKRGLMNRFVLKVSDEPPGFSYWYKNLTGDARAVGLPMMTCFNSIDWKEAEPYINKVAIWEPLYMGFSQEFSNKVKQAGILTGWYNCGPPPRSSIGASASEIRSYVWQAAKADLDIVAWWNIQAWPADNTQVWLDRHSHNDSSIYPPDPDKPQWLTHNGKGWVDTGPIDSIRWELIGEGMEDANRVRLLRTLIGQARGKGMGEAADKAQAVLDDIWRNVFPTLNDYHPPYSKIYESRHAVGQAIVDLQTAIKTTKMAAR